MARPFNLQGKIFFSGDPDGDGELLISAYSSTVFATRDELRQLRDHLNEILDDGDRDPLEGAKVRILLSSHRDLIGKFGTVRNVTPTGNLLVWVENSAIILPRGAVELV